MALGQMIKFNGSGVVHGSALASGVSVDNLSSVQSFVKKRMTKGAKLQVKKLSPQSVMDAQKRTEAIKAQVEFFKQVSSEQLEQVDAALDVLQVGVQHEEGMQTREERYQKIMDGHSRNTLKHRLRIGLTQAGNEGYAAAYSERASSFDAL